MSASQEKKRRALERAEGRDKETLEMEKADKKTKRNKLLWSVLGIVLVLAFALAIVLNTNLFYKNFAAVQIGDEDYTAAEVEFFYKTNYYNFVEQNSSYLAAMGLDVQKPLSSQSFDEGQTWADFFKEQAVSSLSNITILWTEAQLAGFELSEEDRESLEAEFTSIQTVSVENGFESTDQFIALNYGKGLDYNTIKELMERSYIAQAYYAEKNDSFTYSNTELNKYYNENASEYDKYNYLYYFIDGSEDTESGIDSKTAMSEAKKTAEDIMKDVKSEESFKAKILAITGAEASQSEAAGSSLSADFADWMKDESRIEGDTKIAESSSGYYLLYYLGSDDNDYNTANVRHILIKAEADENGAYSEEAKQTAESKAEGLLEEWMNGEAAEESFAELANSHSEDPGSNTNGGLYMGIYKGQMVEEFNDWCFDESRQPGDSGIVFNEGSYCGYHIIYYVDDGDNYRTVIAERELRIEDYNAWYEEVSAKYTIEKGFTLRFVK